MKTERRREQQGVALVVTMIVMAVMAVVAVAFMQSAFSDRAAANSMVGNYQALLAAEAAVESAAGQVGLLLSPAAGAPPLGAGSTELFARPLVSGASNVPLAGIGSAMPFDPVTMVNLNATNKFNPDPWIGYRSTTNTGAPVMAARWIYISRDGGTTNTTNPPIARYAFWVEDESFKLNVNVATNGPRAAGEGAGPGELTLDGTLRASSLLSGYTARTTQMLSDRAGLAPNGFGSAGTAALALGLEGSTNLAAWRFLTTTHSAGLNLSRGGFKRFNINSVTNGIGGPTDAANIRTSLDRIIAAITNSNSAPNFGQRFYRLSTTGADVNATNLVTTNHAAIYLNKIAANIFDYVDADDQPTVVNNDNGFTLRTGKPDFGIEALGGGNQGTNSVVAMGVENLPRLQEYAIHGRIRKMDPIGYNSGSAPSDPKANYEISIDHYFEFWNPGTRDITLTNAFLKIYDQPSFGQNITGVLATEGRPSGEIPLDGITFPAGRVTVLTTAPASERNSLLLGTNSGGVVSLEVNPADRIFSGVTRDVSINSYAGFDRLFRVVINARSSGSTDYESAVLLGNNSGILESFVGLPIAFTGANANNRALHFVVNTSAKAATIGDINAGNLYYARGGSLRGNSTASVSPSSTEGDPRALNEQLEVFIYNNSSPSPTDQTRFYISNLSDTNVPAQSSLGRANTNFVRPTNWIDFSSMNSSVNDAPLVVGNGSLRSIGQLGNVTDPARVPGTVGALTNVAYSRGGGRTLRIGQPEHPRWYDGNQTNASRTWTSWRLADIFGVSSALKVPGLINPNGILRDGGAAFRAALHGMVMLPSPEGASITAGQSVVVDNVVQALLARMTNLAGSGLPPGALNPFWERGEVSQLPLFNSGVALAGVDMSNSFDRGREELVRRSIEMIATRGSVFTVYAMGQALQATPLATNVTGSARLKVTYEMLPEFSDPTAAAADDFNPANAAEVAARFRGASGYSSRVISVSYE